MGDGAPQCLHIMFRCIFFIVHSQSFASFYSLSCQAPERKLQDLNIVETALANTDLFSTLVGFVEAADLVTTLSGEGPFTVFAPTNDAFAALPAETVAALTADTSLLAQVLTYHVVPEEVLLKIWKWMRKY